ncbi:hypothetical protein NM208_g4671 [Fusarium decemcellulare]|uniref:Uncharacterized protein n=2 Tax=Fusarium decemcellulare TaxID=57161 RepID=A0ACC1SK66_9HYPO|nr:hypothetical protein NM208_g6951 [Fusarium decemcellulare]KAJ3541302.1 hypothetical protein NM208_g4671 [Fusarium decemcellulare]
MATSTPFSVSGKTAIITGAGSGINFCFAKLLLSGNCNVLIADLSLRPEAGKLLEEYPSSPRAVFQKTDVSSWKDLNAMFTACFREFGQVDLVCPGAGVFEPTWSGFWHPPGCHLSRDDPEGDRYASMDINLTHPLRVAQLAISSFLNPSAYGSDVPKASPTNPKRVIFISSTSGESAGLTTPLYYAAKHAISGFIRCMAELEPLGIRCSAVAPGLIKTPLFTDNPEKMRYVDESQASWVTPEFVAECLLALAEDDQYQAGTVLRVGKTVERIPLFNNPGPSYGKDTGHSSSNVAHLRDEIYGLLQERGWGVNRTATDGPTSKL